MFHDTASPAYNWALSLIGSLIYSCEQRQSNTSAKGMTYKHRTGTLLQAWKQGRWIHGSLSWVANSVPTKAQGGTAGHLPAKLHAEQSPATQKVGDDIVMLSRC